jgi:ADP-ribose pyrophosphatase YjhB (NUDIX family)
MGAVKRATAPRRMGAIKRATATLMSMAATTLPAQPLPYRGVLIDWTIGEVPPAEDFQNRLAPSLERWRVEGIKSAMLKLPIEHAGLATIAAEHGFTFHHVPLEANGHHVVLKKWLQPELTDKVPPFATHQVGVAGLCMDDQGNMLVVKEWRDDAASGTRVPSAQWKLPGGLLDCGESFGDAAMRETFEETGVQTRFQGLLCFWHRHGLTWGKSDLYYVARLEPADAASTVINVDPEEISDCRWMSISEFLETQDHPLITAVLSRCYGIDSPEEAEQLARPAPLVELLEAGLQWPNREPYPTYFGTSSSTVNQ